MFPYAALESTTHGFSTRRISRICRGDPFAFDLRIKILDNAARKADVFGGAFHVVPWCPPRYICWLINHGIFL